MTLNECFNKLLQIPDEVIRNFEKHKTEMPEGVSKPKANKFQEELERIWQPGYVSFQKIGVYDETGFKNQKP